MADLAGSAVRELPRTWRRAVYVAVAAIGITVAYFGFIQGPIATAQSAANTNGHRLDKVENDISEIKNSVSDIQASSAARDQKVDDIKSSVDAISEKLDRMLERQAGKAGAQ